MNNVNVASQYPSGYTPEQKQAAFNNTQAQALALGDPRGALKRGNLIRPGMSVGRGQRNQAGIQGAQEMSSAIAQAYDNDLQANAYNAQTQLAGQQANEQYAQALAGLQQQSSYNAQNQDLQRQNMMLGFFGNMLGGLLD
jgi:hypothetical protein